MDSFVNMMSEETDVDAIQMSQDVQVCDARGSGGGARGSGGGARGVKRARTNNYSHNEDIQLCISWDTVGNDPITGNEQPSKTYWMRIHDHYHANKTFVSERTANSLEHRWGTIQRECLKYQACFEKIERRHPSGVPHQEHELEASALYANNATGNKNFAFNHCWLKIRHSPKFLALMPNRKPSSPTVLGDEEELGGDGSQKSPTPDSSIPIPPKRPMGRKQAKEKEKEKRGVQVGPYKEAIHELVLVKEKDHEFKRERWRDTRMLEERKIMVEEARLKWEQEQKVMFCDVSTLDENQKMYVLAKRAELAAASVAALNNGGLGGTSFGGGSGSFGGNFGGGDGNGVDFSSI